MRLKMDITKGFGIAAVFAVLMLFVMNLTGCSYRGYDIIDTNYHFDRAIIELPNGEVVEGKVKTWADAKGEQLTVTFEDGSRYLVNSVNCVLIEDTK